MTNYEVWFYNLLTKKNELAFKSDKSNLLINLEAWSDVIVIREGEKIPDVENRELEVSE